MRRQLLLLNIFLILLYGYSSSQVAISNSPATPDATSMLDIQSTTKGVLIPRMNTGQRTSIVSPAAGLLVFDNTTSSFWFYSGGWIELVTSSSGWKLTGNSGTDTSVNFIGTTDIKDLKFRVNNTRAGTIGVGGNVFLGVSSGSQTTGSNNVGIGKATLSVNTTGFRNTAIGTASMSNSNGWQNSALGFNSLFSNTSGNGNTALGDVSLQLNTTGNGNTAVGQASLFNNTAGYSNVAIGIDALNQNTTRSNLVAVGDSALYNNGIGAVSISHAVRNTAVGSKALYSNTIGTENTAIGFEALKQSTGANFNLAVGAYALTNNTATNNTALGHQALTSNTVGIENTAVGRGGLASNTIGGDNTAIGFTALNANTVGNYNTAEGANALVANLSGNSNTANGAQSLMTNNSGSNNTATGRLSLAANTFGFQNTAVGYTSLWQNTVGNYNTAVGGESLLNNSSGHNNTAVGDASLAGNTSGTANTAIGKIALNQNTTGGGNTALGTAALSQNTTGSYNVGLGDSANVFSSNLTNAIAIGYRSYVSANNSMVLGSINGVNGALSDVSVGIGTTAPTGRLHIKHNSFPVPTVLLEETEDDYTRMEFRNTSSNSFWQLNAKPQTTATNASMEIWNVSNGVATTPIVIKGNGNVGVGTSSPSEKLHVVGNILASGTITPSDARFKKNIHLISDPIRKLLLLNGVTYQYRADEFPGRGFTDDLQVGVIAQDVEKVFPQLVITDDKGYKAVDYPKLIPVLIEAIKDQQIQIDQLKKELKNKGSH